MSILDDEQGSQGASWMRPRRRPGDQSRRKENPTRRGLSQGWGFLRVCRRPLVGGERRDEGYLRRSTGLKLNPANEIGCAQQSRQGCPRRLVPLRCVLRGGLPRRAAVERGRSGHRPWAHCGLL
jgi:hypothetical protein